MVNGDPVPIHIFITSSTITTLKGESMKIGEKNVGTIDRDVRIIVGIALLAVFALNMVAAPWSYLVALIGIIALVTGAAGTCALYSLIGINTAAK